MTTASSAIAPRSHPWLCAIQWVLMSTLAFVLIACGGGADAPPPPESAPPTPVAPTITQQPASLTVAAGQPATFTVAATGTEPLSYQWRLNGAAIAGATNASYQVAAAANTDDGAVFSVVVGNMVGSVTSVDARLTVTSSAPAPVLTITQQPANLTVPAGSAASFTVAGNCSAGTLNIQWQRNTGANGAFENVANATTGTLTIGSAATSDSGAQFRAALDCSGQSAATSQPATLTVTAPAAASLAALPIADRRVQAHIVGAAIDQLPDGSWAMTTDRWVKRLAADQSSITVIAGSGQSGSADGPATTASFNGLKGVTHDASGNLYVTDGSNGTIRRIAADGTVTTIAGLAGTSGHVDGTGSAARFNSPSGIVLGPDGDLYVTEDGGSMIRRVTMAGVVTTYAGGANNAIGLQDGPAATALFNAPQGIVAAPNGDLYVADRSNNVIRRILRSGNGAGNVETLAGNGANNEPGADATGTAAGISGPYALALSGNVLAVRDGAGLVRHIDITTKAVTTFTGSRTLGRGYADGAPGVAQLRGPSAGGISVAPNNGYLTLDSELRTIDAAGNVRTIAVEIATSDNTGTGLLAQMPFIIASNERSGLAVDGAGNVVVAVAGDLTVRRIAPSGAVSLVAGLVNSYAGMIDGVGSIGQFSSPGGQIARDAAGNLYVIDGNAIRRIDTSNKVTMLAGYRVSFPEYGTIFGYADAQGTAALFNSPTGLVIGRDGALYVSDFGNCVIRRVDMQGNTTTYAGAAGQCSISDGTLTGARFRQPGQMAVSADGTLWVADRGALRRIGTDGMVTSVSSVGPVGALAFDSQGNMIYTSDTGLYKLPSGTNTPIQLIPGAVNGAVVLGNNPQLGSTQGMALRDDHSVILISGGQLLVATLP
ncbi:hypothetical protein SNE35_12005 [Paucibacter sp. R3-3]|uniref:Ig-like domain-containing protein n=1 Tax=Roseateles agri TaxID=3098619 RepID=A0ABU5DG20_9BURK|nr:hypothetical protein [Paucibacter sp. R3-3]MDY0745235.1 hypothetical protein [Paucibacter sp. R3-3]